MKIERNDRLERIFGMVGKEFRQLFRDPRMSRVVFLAPIIQLVIFGYAVSTDIWKTATFVVDHDRTRTSRELVESLMASGYFQVVGRSDRSSDLEHSLDHGDAVVGVEIPAGFATTIQDGSGGKVQILLDGTNSNTALLAQRYATQIFQNYGVRASKVETPMAIDLRERAWFNPDLSSRNYNVPAVVGMLILLVSLLLTSLAVVREREIGTLEQLRVSPLSPVELIIGKSVPFAIIGLVDLTVVTTIALLWFGIPFRGSFALLFLASALYILSGVGLGLLISTISKTQQEAFMSTLLVMMPAILLSGFMFPVSSMPELFQWITFVNPVRHYIEIVRSIFLKGTGLTSLWRQYLWLLILGSILLSFAATRFRKVAG